MNAGPPILRGGDRVRVRASGHLATFGDYDPKDPAVCTVRVYDGGDPKRRKVRVEDLEILAPHPRTGTPPPRHEPGAER